MSIVIESNHTFENRNGPFQSSLASGIENEFYASPWITEVSEKLLEMLACIAMSPLIVRAVMGILKVKLQVNTVYRLVLFPSD